MTKALAIVVCVMAVSNMASADSIHGIDMDFVTIDQAGNAGDARAEAFPTGCGAVGYNYRIGKYEITNAQWNIFTAAVGAPAGDDGGYSLDSYYTGSQQPANRISWYEAIQFCNYLTSGDKSKGVYQFSGDNTNPGSFLGIDRAAALAAYGTIYVLPTQDEWYKAAYYKPDGSGFSLYANGTNTAPIAGVQSNFGGTLGSTPWNVGIGAQEQNGTYDMMGNVWEWNETLISEFLRGLRGGAFNYYVTGLASSSQDNGASYSLERTNFGFRVASIPEPATLILFGAAVPLMLRRRRLHA